MKKFVLLLVILLVLGGMAWGQVPPDPPWLNPPFEPDYFGTTSDWLFLNSGGKTSGLWATNMFDAWNVVPTLSTEARYSNWIFQTDVDNFIDPNFYDPKIGTFLFFGGYPVATGGGVENTDNLTAPGNYAISFGFGKTFKNFYLGVYYGGSLVNADGQYEGQNPRDISSSVTMWSNNLAILVGLSQYGLGAFRLDVNLNTVTKQANEDDNVVGKTRNNAPSIALTWGGQKVGGLVDPYVTVGYKFADQIILGGYSGSSYKSATYTYNSALGLQAGVNYDIDENRSVWGDLAVGYVFGRDFSGDTVVYNTWVGGALSGNTFSASSDGIFAIAFRANYKHILQFGKLSFGFNPNMLIGFVGDGSNNISGDIKEDEPTDHYFNLLTGLNLGLKFQATQKFAFYTGAGLTLFNWQTYTHPGKKAATNNYSAWSFSGISWDPNQFATNGQLGIGMTFTPIDNLIIGCGLNTLLDKFVQINLREMKIDSGDFFDQTQNDSNNIGGWAGYMFQNLHFDLTVSYKF